VPLGTVLLHSAPETGKMPSVCVNGIELSYQTADYIDPWETKKEYLLLLHGWMGCKESWVRQIPFFARDFVVVTPDLRGFGESAKPPSGYTVEEYVRDIAALLDALSIDRAHVLGQSFGGIIAQQFAISCGERVQSLILWATRSEPIGTGGVDAVVEFIGREGMAAFAEMFSGQLADESEPEITEWNKRLVAGGEPHVAIESLRAISCVHITAELHRINVPTLILASRSDQVIPFEFAEKLRRHIPQSTLYEYRGSHGAYLKNPDECNQVILEFLKGLPRVEKR
jgi:3-oxoadipate enol-lactonase